MRKNKLITPEGTKDLLFEDCTARRQVEERIKKVFALRGFQEVVTPGIEFYDVFSAENRGIAEESMYKLVDHKGRLLSLKPDLTMPIARLAATRLKGYPLPLRLYYNQNVYCASPTLKGRRDEETQIGIEVIGAAGSRTDLEVLAIAAKALESCGLSDYRLEIGHIGLFNTLIRKLSISPEGAEEIRNLIESKNFPALNDRLDKLDNKKIAGALRLLPSLFGGEEVFEKAAVGLDCEEILPILDALKAFYADLSKLGLGDRVSLDLGIVNRNDYYTGIVFKGYIEGLGTIALMGGRYDTLLSDYGVDLPAIGFGINVDAVANVLKESLPGAPKTEVLVYAEPGHEVEGLAAVEELFKAGRISEYSLFSSREESEAYAREKKIPRLLVVGEEKREVQI